GVQGVSMSDDEPFALEEVKIDQLHGAIKAGRTTCVAVVQHYIGRARVFNGVCSRLVTEDGAPVPKATGAVRATAPLRFPAETVKASTIFPDLDKYKGPPLEFGRMEPTASDPFGTAAIRNDHRDPKCRAAQRTCDAQHQRRALGDLPRRVRPASFRGTVAAGRTAGLRTLPPIARCARTRRRARCRLRARSRSRQDADVRRPLLVQGPVRHQRYANGRRG